MSDERTVFSLGDSSYKTNGLTISESVLSNEDGTQGKVAVFLYSGLENPSPILTHAVRTYVGDKEYHEFIDIGMDNPWMRVVLSNINDMSQEVFDKEKHSL